MIRMKCTIFNISVLGSILLLSACSTSSDNKAEPLDKIYSSETESDFREIEQSDLPGNTIYRSNQNNTPQKSKKIAARKLIMTNANEKIATPQLSSNKKLGKNAQERLQEINQNLAFFCMKHRKDSRFQSEEKCQRFTKSVLEKCEKKHQIINTVMVKCVKEKLKKRN